MTNFPNSPRLLKGGIVVIDPVSAVVQRVIALQYNPDSLSRTLQVQVVEGEGGDRSEALCLTGPAVETVKLDAENRATDLLGCETKATYPEEPVWCHWIIADWS